MRVLLLLLALLISGQAYAQATPTTPVVTGAAASSLVLKAAPGILYGFMATTGASAVMLQEELRMLKRLCTKEKA